MPISQQKSQQHRGQAQEPAAQGIGHGAPRHRPRHRIASARPHSRQAVSGGAVMPQRADSSAHQQTQNATASATPQNCKRKATQQASGERWSGKASSYGQQLRTAAHTTANATSRQQLRPAAHTTANATARHRIGHGEPTPEHSSSYGTAPHRARHATAMGTAYSRQAVSGGAVRWRIGQ